MIPSFLQWTICHSQIADLILTLELQNIQAAAKQAGAVTAVGQSRDCRVPPFMGMEGHHRKKVTGTTFKMATPLCQCYQVRAWNILYLMSAPNDQRNEWKET